MKQKGEQKGEEEMKKLRHRSRGEEEEI